MIRQQNNRLSYDCKISGSKNYQVHFQHSLTLFDTKMWHLHHNILLLQYSQFLYNHHNNSFLYYPKILSFGRERYVNAIAKEASAFPQSYFSTKFIPSSYSLKASLLSTFFSNEMKDLYK